MWLGRRLKRQKFSVWIKVGYSRSVCPAHCINFVKSWNYWIKSEFKLFFLILNRNEILIIMIKHSDKAILLLPHLCLVPVVCCQRQWLYNPKQAWTQGPEVIKLFSCSTQLRMKFVLLIKYQQFKLFSCKAELSMKIFLQINIKMPTIVGILILISRNEKVLQSRAQVSDSHSFPFKHHYLKYSPM